jgi:PAS domain-containing protein
MNQVAEELTGWLLKDARGQECATMFRIKNQQTGQSVESPLAKVLREGMIVGVANHSLLLRRDGTEIPIDDSGAPIREANGAAIALTGFGMDEDIVRSRESGFFGHLTKPVNFQQLRELINQVPLA